MLKTDAALRIFQITFFLQIFTKAVVVPLLMWNLDKEDTKTVFSQSVSRRFFSRTQRFILSGVITLALFPYFR